jgi:hypothetical protein
VLGQKQPRSAPEACKTAAAKHGSRRIESGRLAAPYAACHPRPSFLLGFVSFNQRGTRGKDRGKCQKQSANDRTPVLSHESSARGYRAPEGEAHRKLRPARIFET